jgi:hypothetical protein
LLDTGFTSNTGFGLKLPLLYANLASNLIAGEIKQADGNKVAVQYIPTVTITSIEGFRLKRSVPLCTCFMTGRPILGMLFLQECRINFDGPKKIAVFQFDL